jgi:NTP pyrophosphatase (non-canonical NTP hydrolase)
MKDLALKTNGLFDLVLSESRSQIKKWGIQDHSLAEWHLILAEEYGELSKAILELQFYQDSRQNLNGTSDIINLTQRTKNEVKKEVKKEAIQVATLALKIAEMYGGPVNQFELDVPILDWTIKDW